jgi:hypothetical protein
VPGAQRYVSDELTHFVGRGLAEEAQYGLLVEILRTGTLTPPPHDPALAGDLAVDLDVATSSNLAYVPRAVSFCDIPVGDLGIHIRKYSPFGLGFRKPLLVDAGATPLFYVAGASRTVAPDARGSVRPLPRAERFDATLREYQRLRARTEAALRASSEDAATREVLEAWLRVAHFLDFEVFSFLKFFEYPTEDEDPQNYYMEREWRLVGDLRFTLADLRRVILPESYAPRLREDIPGYHGQVMFAGTAG